MLIEAGDNNKLIDYTIWEDGQTGSVGEFIQNGATSENSRVIAPDPWGRDTVVWESSSSGAGDPDGGWNQNSFSIDNTKTYRFTVWINRYVTGTDGRFYFGLNGYGGDNELIRVSSGASLSNAYFYTSSDPPTAGELPEDEWILMVAHVHPYTYSDTANHVDSGRYKITGYFGSIAYDYKWKEATTSSRHRTYLYYANLDTSATQRWCFPRIDVVDGTEPSINKLLSGFYYDYQPNNHISKTGNVYSPNFHEVGPIESLSGYWPMNGDLRDSSSGDANGTSSGADLTYGGPKDRAYYDFTGATTDKIELDSTITCSAGSEWSWSFWGYKASYGNHGIAGNQTTSSNGRISFTSSSTIRCWTSSSNQTVTVSTFPSSEWFSCIITHTTGNIFTIYLNGTQVGQSTALAGNILVNRLGDNPDDSAWTSFAGFMFDFRIYDKVLDSTEIGLLAKMFDDDGTSTTYMSLETDALHLLGGEFKEQL